MFVIPSDDLTSFYVEDQGFFYRLLNYANIPQVTITLDAALIIASEQNTLFVDWVGYIIDEINIEHFKDQLLGFSGEFIAYDYSEKDYVRYLVSNYKDLEKRSLPKDKDDKKMPYDPEDYPGSDDF